MDKKLLLQKACNKFITKTYPYVLGVRVRDISHINDRIDVIIDLITNESELKKINISDSLINFLRTDENGNVWRYRNFDLSSNKIRKDLKDFIKLFYNERINTLEVHLKLLPSDNELSID